MKYKRNVVWLQALQRLWPRSEHTAATWEHRDAVGGMWEELGKLQFDLLLSCGLKPQHKLLDIGCGALRGGIHFARYLDENNYYGIDASDALLAAGRRELAAAGIEDERVTLCCRDDFGFASFGVQFDYALAQSVFTHLPVDEIAKCLKNSSAVLRPQGQLLATFFEDATGLGEDGPLIHAPAGIATHLNADPYHQTLHMFYRLGHEHGFGLEYVPSWQHPRGQRLLVFTRLGITD